MKKAGFDQFMVGPELEDFYFKDDKHPETLTLTNHGSGNP